MGEILLIVNSLLKVKANKDFTKRDEFNGAEVSGM